MEELLTHITLHDSAWYNTMLGRGNSWIVIISLDAIWNKDFCHQLEDWPFLIIKFQNVLGSFQDFDESDNYASIIGGAQTVQIKSGELTEWTDYAKIAGILPMDVWQKIQSSDSLYRAEIDTIYGGLFSLVHTPAVEILLYSEQGSQLSIDLSSKEE